MYARYKMIAGCKIYQGRVGKRPTWWKFMRKEDIPSVFGMAVDWATNLLKIKNFENLHEFSRWSYENVLFFPQSVSEMLFL